MVGCTRDNLRVAEHCIRPNLRAVAVRWRSFAATSTAGGRSGRCIRSDSVPGNPGARAPPPRNRQRAKARSPPCPATAQRPQRRRWCLRRRGVVARSCRKCRPVACAPVVSLPVGRRRVVDLEEELQQVAKARLAQIERDLDRFRVRSVVAVRGVLDIAARIADPRRDDTGQAPHQLLHSPEATPARIARSVVAAIVRPPALRRASRTRRTPRSPIGRGG
jgi:hypothetical protein